MEIYTSSAWAPGIPLTHSREHNVTLQFLLVKEDKIPKTCVLSCVVWEHFKLSDKTKAVCQICKSWPPTVAPQVQPIPRVARSRLGHLDFTLGYNATSKEHAACKFVARYGEAQDVDPFKFFHLCNLVELVKKRQSFEYSL